ncbi:alpha/beta hydrolase [Paraburkholderia sp. D15]|uniref:alpha/beta fold hydrolase n=1 Tax=Paraburkholderia sp. D15 TaxID=2880218 RepID=UPI0024790C57|nr:alpha/beta hydrolase [Paraburkholderia sp. D15]WGS48846.1 alpha/beta hydrolase [Paraburkholderia sp. D15]
MSNTSPFHRKPSARVSRALKLGRAAVLSVALGLPVALASTHAAAEPVKPDQAVRNVVLVHGAFVDASIWNEVITILAADGYNVAAVQLPLTSLADDVHATREVLSHMNGPTLLAGYSWGGEPVSEVGVDPKVRGMVYFAAITPDVGQSLRDLLKSYPAMPGSAAIYDGENGMLWMKPELFAFALAHDSSRARTNVMSVAQKPTSKRVFDDAPTQAAWKTKPSWYVVASEDKIIPVDLQRKLAAKIGATKFELPTGHAIILSQPEASARIIEQAAQSLSAKSN